MIVFLDIETTKHIPIPEDSFMAEWIAKKNERARTRMFSPYLDKFTAVPSLMGVQIYYEDRNELFNAEILESEHDIANRASAYFAQHDMQIITFNGDSFDIPILLRLCIKVGYLAGISNYDVERLFKGRHDKTLDLMKILAPHRDEMKPLRFFAESLGIPVKKETANIFEGLDEGKEIPLPDLKEKLLDDLRLTREIYFKIMGIKPVEVSNG